ncbi:MAG: type I-E CRISPR-associated protein Cse1/CasA [Candidatus Thiodiazotropha sp. (ex Dulcina madagascariensis)]|nr:type I-E CRISPR-associated protein Cse1/CasA [Candidatus Thiodiazotropha sp. (ex Dulcina madagascariensis)]MCU7928139.1 type I-E CRISPR-associated protein Cse1/CasA [Candidatus Thiodiazotropha sp. (ex Dulcina madagascariensis)]
MNLLTDPVFHAQTLQGLKRLSLPALLVALGRDEIDSLASLQHHQEDAFHIFLCYLAAAVLQREQKNDPKQEEAFWCDAIRRLDDGGDSAWTLVVKDVTQPAFMQPALPSRILYEEKFTKNGKAEPDASTPDNLDLLATSKNHDIKARRTNHDSEEAWVYALINLQTMTCRNGAGNEGVARMSGTFSARIRVQLLVSKRPGKQWSRDVQKLLKYRPIILNRNLRYKPDGIVLTWVAPWDLESSYITTDLDPFFIEISRARRLVITNRGIAAYNASALHRVLPKSVREQIKGDLGDPWIPIDTEKSQAFNVYSEGFTPRITRNLLFGVINNSEIVKRPYMQEPETDDSDCWFYASGLSRRGKDSNTEGFHDVYIPMKKEITHLLFSAGKERDNLAAKSEEGLHLAGEIEDLLKAAMRSLLLGGPNKPPKREKDVRREIQNWSKKALLAYTEAWYCDYFDWLWRTLDHKDEEQARIEWLNALKEKALTVLEAANTRLPERQGRRYRARVKARGLFFGSLYKQFPELKEQRDAKQST